MKKLLLKTMLLLCALVAGSGTMWADTATITFASTGSDSNTAYTTSDFVSGGIASASTAFGTISCSATAKCYNGKNGYGLKAGGSGKAGSFTISFSTPIANVTQITLNRASYNETKTATITVKNGSTTLADAVSTPSSSAAFSDMDITSLSIASLSGLTVNTSQYCYIKSITITYTAAASHTLSSAVSPSATGTVTLGKTTVNEGATTSISAAPSDGYRFVNWTVSGTGSSVTSTTLASTTFTMGTADATVTANFEAIPSHTLSSAVSPVGAGTVTLGATSVREGSTTTAEAAANSGYKFTGWSITGTGAELSSTTDNPTTVTMGTANATVTATFEAVKTYEINWRVNGTIIKTENVEENADLDFSAPASGVPAGYAFKGWVVAANKIDTPTDTDPKANYVTSGKSTADITYYAVLAVESTSSYTAHLTGDEIAANFAATAQAYGDAEKSYTDTSDDMTWGARCITNATRHWIQLKSDADVYIEAAAAGTITEVKVKISNATNSSGGIDDITKHGAFSGNVYLDNAQATNTGTYGSASSSAIVSNILTITPTKSSSTLYIHVDASARIWNVDVTYNKVTSSHFCTTVEDYPVTIGAAGYTTYTTADKVSFPDGVTGYIATAKSASTVTLTSKTSVPASTPIVLKATAGTYYLPIITTTPESVTGNLLLTSDGSAKGNGSTIYALAKMKIDEVDKVGFYQVDNDVTIPAGKAYIVIGGGGAKSFLTFDFDEVDGIGSIDNGQLTMDNERIFRLDGTRVNGKITKKGLYIRGGRKVVVK